MENMEKSREFFGKNKKGLNLGWNFWIIQRSHDRSWVGVWK